METELKYLLGYVAKSADEKAVVNEDQRRIRFVISSDEIDRDRERIEPAAIAAAIPGFSKNPTALACHLHRLSSGDSPVVGSWDTESFKGYQDRCEMDLLFARTELGEQYWTLYKDGHMRAVSIGFAVKDFKYENIDKDKRICVITRIELYEISCVPVGANRDALAKYKDLLSGYYEERGTGDEGREKPDPETQETILRRLDQLEESVTDLQCLIAPDSEKFAAAYALGVEASDPNDAAGAEVNSEQLVTACRLLERAIENLTKNSET